MYVCNSERIIKIGQNLPKSCSNKKRGSSFYRAMLCKSGLCYHAVSVCLSVRPSVTFVDHVKTNKDIFEIFSLSGSDTSLVLPSQSYREEN